VLLILFGAVPTGYALYLALTTPGGRWDGLQNFVWTGRNYLFLPAFEHIGLYILTWLVLLVVLVLVLAFLLQAGIQRLAPFFRLLFYIPGALAGAASVLVWTFMLDPTVSPWRFVESALHLGTLQQTVAPGHLPAIFAVIAIWTGAGAWVVIISAALNNIPDELIGSALVDGANAWQLARHVKLPLIRRWVVYMLILAFATGTQLFVEPQLVGQASGGLVSQYWSLNQVAYFFAFTAAQFNHAAAISVDLLFVGLLAAGLLVWRSKLFATEADTGVMALAPPSRERGSRAAPIHWRLPSARRRSFRRSWPRVVWLAVMLAFACFFAVPVIWLMLAATKSGAQLGDMGPMAFGSFRNFLRAWDGIYAFQGHQLMTWLENSAIYSIGGLALALACALPTGYGLAVIEFTGRKLLLGITLVVMIMPATALVLPLFLEMDLFHLLGTAWSVVLPFGFFPFGVYLSYIFFSSSLPKELLGAARVDGANEWDLFRWIALPLARPIVVLVAFFAFVANWTNFFLPFVMLDNDKQYPLPAALEYLLSSVSRPELAVATLVAIAPVLIVFVFAQRALATGMLARPGYR
jgi:multiple sugar transport system permease protein